MTSNTLPSHPIPPLCARMMSLVHALKPVHRDVGVHLCCSNIGVSQDRLNGTQVSAVSDHVRRATVAKHVRTGLPIELGFADDPPHALACEASSIPVHEHQRRPPQSTKLRTRVAQVHLQPIPRRNPEGDYALFISLAAHNCRRSL